MVARGVDGGLRLHDLGFGCAMAACASTSWDWAALNAALCSYTWCNQYLTAAESRRL